MTFKKYNVANEAIALLNLPITETSSSLELKTGYEKFPTSNFIIKVSEYDIDDVLVSQEIMLCSTRSGNILNISARKYEFLPKNDESSTSVKESYTFAENSVVEVINTAELYIDMQEEIARLESDKLDKGGLRTALTNAWKFFFSNGSSNETELAFGDSGKYLKSTGASSTPVWDNPPLDINGQTTSTSPTTSWLVPLSDGTNNFKTTLANLVKGLATATTSQAGVVEMATDVEASAGTDESRYVNSKQLGDVTEEKIEQVRLPYEGTSEITLNQNGGPLSGTISKNGIYLFQIVTDGSKDLKVYKNGVLIIEVLGSTNSYDKVVKCDQGDTILITQPSYSTGHLYVKYEVFSF